MNPAEPMNPAKEHCIQKTGTQEGPKLQTQCTLFAYNFLVLQIIMMIIDILHVLEFEFLKNNFTTATLILDFII